MKHVKRKSPKKTPKKKQQRMENTVEAFLSERVIASNGIKLQHEKWTYADVSDSVD